MSYGDPNNLLFMNDGNPTWYESPDVTIPNDQAAVGSNTVTVTGRKNPGASPSSQIRIDGFLCNPFVGPMVPGTANVASIGHVFVSAAALDTAGPAVGVTTTLPPFTIPAPPANPTQAQMDDPFFAPSHRCLVARIYPSNFTPPAVAFTPQTEQHEVQHNIEVVLVAMQSKMMAAGAGTAGAGAMGAPPLGPRDDGLFEFRVDTTTRTKRPEKVTVRATWPAKHPPEELRRLAVLMKRHHQRFRGLAEARPQRFALSTEIPKAELPHFKGLRPYVPKVLEVKDRSKVKTGNPRFETQIGLQARKVARLSFLADIRETQVGFAHVFRLEQFGAKGRPEGGLTVIFLRVR